MTSLHFCRVQQHSSRLPPSSAPWIFMCDIPWRDRDSGEAQQGQPCFSQWAARLLFPISLPVMLRAEAWWPRAAESAMHINSADAAPGVSHARDSALHPNSLRGTLQGSFQTPPSMEGGSKGSWETDVPLMQTQIFLMSSVELNQLHQQRKFSFFPRAEMVSCSLAHPCPAWALY